MKRDMWCEYMGLEMIKRLEISGQTINRWKGAATSDL